MADDKRKLVLTAEEATAFQYVMLRNHDASERKLATRNDRRLLRRCTLAIKPLMDTAGLQPGQFRFRDGEVELDWQCAQWWYEMARDFNEKGIFASVSNGFEGVYSAIEDWMDEVKRAKEKKEEKPEGKDGKEAKP